MDHDVDVGVLVRHVEQERHLEQGRHWRVPGVVIELVVGGLGDEEAGGQVAQRLHPAAGGLVPGTIWTLFVSILSSMAM